MDEYILKYFLGTLNMQFILLTLCLHQVVAKEACSPLILPSMPSLPAWETMNSVT